MRISDWSSDVCSSDLSESVLSDALAVLQANCSGSYVSGQRASVDSARALRTHGSHACEADDFFADATVIAWTDGFVTVCVPPTHLPDAQVAAEVGTAIRDRENSE